MRPHTMGAVALLMAALLAGGARGAPPEPKLVVVLSIDQFSLELFQRYRPTFAGGLRRLSDGVSFTGFQSHAATETCPGHSTILTGDHPARTGIVANNWYDRSTGSNVYCVSVRGEPGASGSEMLRVDTLGDWLKAQRPGARSVAISGKDRAAIMMAGHHPDAVYWWEDGVGFTTNRHAGPATPAVLQPAKDFDRALLARWRASPPALWPSNPPARCKGLETAHTFGHVTISGTLPPEASKGVETGDFPADARFEDQLRASPAFDPLTLRFAESIIAKDRLGRGPSTDLLAVSLSATDHLGHRYGNGGAEMCAQIDALDRALGGLFAKLDALGVPYVAALTADHGSVDAPERLGPPAKRIDIASLISALSAHLRKTFALSYDPLAGDDPRQIIFNLGPADEAKRASMREDALAWLKARPEVAAAFSAEEVAHTAPPAGKPVTDLTLAERFNESYDHERSGDVLVAYSEGSTLGVPMSPYDTVAGHGSPWDYDRRVPILFWWPGASAEAKAAPMETIDIAPTLASIIGITPPPVDGRCVDLGQGCPGAAAARP